MAYNNGERGEWVADCDCPNCPGEYWQPSHYGPVTLTDYQTQQMMINLYTPIIEQQLKAQRRISKFFGTGH